MGRNSESIPNPLTALDGLLVLLAHWPGPLMGAILDANAEDAPESEEDE